MINAIRMSNGQEKFDKEELIEEKVIGTEKVKIEKGHKLILCNEYKEEQEANHKEEDSYIADGHRIYAVEKSHNGEYNTIPSYFLNKKDALSYFKECCQNFKQNNVTQEQSKDKKESKSLHIEGIELMGDAYISHSPIELEELAKHDHLLIRKAVANNPFTSTETLTYLSKYGDYELELMIINNPNVDIAYLEKIITDNKHIDKVLVAKANIIKRKLFMDLSRVFILK